MSRRVFIQRVVLIGGSLPIALALLQAVGISADAAEISDAPRAPVPTPKKRLDGDVRCSFCNKGQDDVRKMMAGPAAFICDECVAVCVDIITDDTVFVPAVAGTCAACGAASKEQILVANFIHLCPDCADRGLTAQGWKHSRLINTLSTGC